MYNEMPKLPYAEDGLSPVISKETIEYHYGKHLQTYVTNLNNLIKGTEYERLSIEEIIRKAPAGPILNNAGQVYNHTMYFEQLTGSPALSEPAGPLADAIKRDFGSFDKMQKAFSDAAIGLFGSGWAWLSADKENKLVIGKYGNGETPIRDGLKPILCIDVWEHAYYIDYQNRRAEYVNSLWRIFNWFTIAARY